VFLIFGWPVTVGIRKPDRVRLSDSILCQSRPFESRTQMSGFWMVASLDRFTKKRVIKNILLMTKRSRLAKEKSPVWLSNGSGHFVFAIWKPDKNCRIGQKSLGFKWSKLAAIFFLPFESPTGQSGFQMVQIGSHVVLTIWKQDCPVRLSNG
jgi:hypothetical protein